MRSKAAVLTALAFLAAAAFSFGMAVLVGNALESRSQRHVQRALNANDLEWVTASADGLLVTLVGTAPSEAIRFRAATVAARVVGGPRIIDQMEVTPPKALSVPQFSLELLRNGDGVSVIGLAPTLWDMDPFLNEARALAPDDFANMVESADFPIPETWDEAVGFGLEALRLLPRSKISIAERQVRVTAIAESPEEKHAFEESLANVVPRNLGVNVSISAPRPVIAPFTLRFVIEEGSARFDACSADTARTRARILAAGRRAGVPDTPSCTLGLGVPSPRWAEAVELLINAVAELKDGSVSISDVDVTLIAGESVTQGDFDHIVGELTSKLPEVFSLKATLTPKPLAQSVEGLAQFTATLSPEGKIQLRGRLRDAAMREMVDAFAKARFGAGNVHMAARFDENLPPTWGSRVLSALGALAEINQGAVLVQPEAVSVRGTTGNPNASSEISRLLSDRLGHGARYSVDVRYEERLDPALGLPTPQECQARAQRLLSDRQIAFAPNASEITGEAATIVDELAKVLADCEGARLEIGGHTDSKGSAEGNLRLSQRRADAVLAALTARDVDTSAITAKGYGAAEPIADNATEEGREQNRRIAIKLLSPKVAETRAPADSLDASADTPPAPAEAAEDEADLPLEDLSELEGAEPMGEAGDLGEGEELEFSEEDQPLDEDPEGLASDEQTEPQAQAPAADSPAQVQAQPPAAGAPVIEAAAVSAGQGPDDAEGPLTWTPDPEPQRLRPVTRPALPDGPPEPLAATPSDPFETLSAGWERMSQPPALRPMPRATTETAE